MEKVNHIYGIGKGVSRLSPNLRNISSKSMINENLYLQVKSDPS